MVRSRLSRILVVTAVVVGAAGGAVVVSSRGDARAQTSKRAWLGVELANPDSPGTGVILKHVVRNSPAARAGLVDGDAVLLADGVTVDEPKQLIARVAVAGPNNSIALKVRHAGSTRDVTAMLVPYPGADEVMRLDKLNTFAPAFKTLAPVSGSVPSSIGALRGRVVVVDFWASWCGPCRMMAPVLSRWQSTFGAQGVTVLGITDDTVSVAAQSAAGMGMSYTVASDASGATQSAYGVSSLPTIFVIDKRGVIRDASVGYDPQHHKEIEALIQKLVAEPAPP